MIQTRRIITITGKQWHLQVLEFSQFPDFPSIKSCSILFMIHIIKNKILPYNLIETTTKIKSEKNIHIDKILYISVINLY